jgi:acetyl esterase
MATVRERVEAALAWVVSRLPPGLARLIAGRPIRIDGQELDVHVQIALRLEKLMGGFEPRPVEEARELRRSEARAFSGPRIALARVDELELPGPAGVMRARRYVPHRAEDPGPLVVYFHGGGHVVGDLDTHDQACRFLAREIPAALLAVDYRCAPESRFPAAVDDALEAFRWVRTNAAELGADPERVAVAGDSAGGNLAATAAIACRDAGIELSAQLLVYPVTDVVGNFADTKENARFPSRSENAEGYFLSRAVMEWFCGHYLADAAHGADWRVSPLRASNLAGVAPAVVTTAWYDPLRDEGKAYAEALKAAGVPTRYHDGPGLIHGYFGLGDASETARREAQRARADFKALLHKGV